MKTSINLPDGLLDRVKTHNRLHPEKCINVSGLTAKELSRVLGEYAKQDDL